MTPKDKNQTKWVGKGSQFDIRLMKSLLQDNGTEIY